MVAISPPIRRSSLMENMDDDKEIPHKTHICAAPPKKGGLQQRMRFLKATKIWRSLVGYHGMNSSSNLAWKGATRTWRYLVPKFLGIPIDRHWCAKGQKHRNISFFSELVPIISHRNAHPIFKKYLLICVCIYTHIWVMMIIIPTLVSSYIHEPT